MGYAPLDSRLTIRQPYDADEVYCLLRRSGWPLRGRAGMFVLFGPQDIHAPDLPAPSACLLKFSKSS